MKPSYTIGAGILALLLNVLAAPQALPHGGEATVVHACVGNLLKVVRIVRPDENCHARLETARHWSIKGPQGLQGPQGIPGPPGAAGNGGNGTGAFVVKDSFDQVVGKSDGAGAVRKIGNDLLYFRIRRTGFTQSFIRFFYLTDNCQGLRYLPVGTALWEFVLTTDGVIGYYPLGPGQPLTMRSFEDVFAGQPIPPQPLSCAVQDVFSTYGEASAINLATVGVPPFRLE